MNKISNELIAQSDQVLNPLGERMIKMTGMKIVALENLGATQDHFDCIDLSDNEIKRLGNFSVLQKLKTLILNNNKIQKIQEIGSSIPNLETLSLLNNKIQDLSEIDNLSECQKLRRLFLYNNAVTNVPNYRLYTIAKIPSLKVLDFQKVTKSEKNQANEMFANTNNTLKDDSLTQKEKIKKLIQSAKTMEEMNRIELLLKSGQLGLN